MNAVLGATGLLALVFGIGRLLVPGLLLSIFGVRPPSPVAALTTS